MAESFWNRPVPERSSFGGVIVDEFVFGLTDHRGNTGFMTPEEYTIHGRGMGSGRGERYKKSEGKWRLIEG
jgi:hypothetical protein